MLLTMPICAMEYHDNKGHKDRVNGFLGILGSRKIAYRYVIIGIGCSVDLYGLLLIIEETNLYQ